MSTWLSAYGYANGGIAAYQAVKLLKQHKPKSALGVGLIAAGLLAFGVLESIDAKDKEKNNNNRMIKNPTPQIEQPEIKQFTAVT